MKLKRAEMFLHPDLVHEAKVVTSDRGDSSLFLNLMDTMYNNQFSIWIPEDQVAKIKAAISKHEEETNDQG
jgi:hypothetical protein